MRKRRRTIPFRERVRNVYAGHCRRAKEYGLLRLDYDKNCLERFVARFIDTLCPYCRLPIEYNRPDRIWSVDHRVPVSRGGSFSLANLEVICADCNMRKGDLTAEEFGQLCNLIYGWPAKAQSSVNRRLKAGGRCFRER